MQKDNAGPTDFNQAANRQSYDKANLPDAARARIAEIERAAEARARQMLDAQQASRANDLSNEEAKLRRGRPDMALTPDGVRSSPTDRDIERKAAQLVNRRNAVALAGITAQRDASIAEVIERHGDSPQKAASEPAPDLVIRKASRADIDAAFTRSAERDNGGRER